MRNSDHPWLIELRAGAYRLVLDPVRGGSVARFDLGDQPLFRATCGPSVLDSGCFPLVPFSNRIAHGTFAAAGQTVRLAPNMPGGAHPHTLHGFGWQCGWDVAADGADNATLRHDHAAGQWPWAYRAEQRLALDHAGLTHTLSLRNASDQPMPAGLGVHPYFPRTPQTRLIARHNGEWQTAADGLPITLHRVDQPVDWWQGQPVGTRAVDTVYTGRAGEITVIWPERGLQLTIAPSPNLPCTVIYTPANADFFCVEPVSHATDAINRPDQADPMQWLTPGETLEATVRYCAGPVS